MGRQVFPYASLEMGSQNEKGTKGMKLYIKETNESRIVIMLFSKHSLHSLRWSIIHKGIYLHTAENADPVLCHGPITEALLDRVF